MMDKKLQKTKEVIAPQIPLYVKRVGDTLISNGYKAYLVGGGVRDLILSNSPKDFDIATDATPDQIESIFPKSVATGAKFGTIVVVMENEHNERFDVEVTTFRSESDYYGGRWPSKVEFTKEIEVDLSRRDFTINSIAIDLDNLEEQDAQVEDFIIDPFNGLEDLKKGLVRAVGDPVERFSEDGLRTIRACRFASTLDFEIEENTYNAIKKCLSVTKMVSIERVRDELNKILMNSNRPSKGFRLLHKTGILEMYIPELVQNVGVTQEEYHSDDVFEHSLKTVDIAEDDIKWAALLHDIGKAVTMEVDDQGTHFYGHDIKGSEIAAEVLKRLKFPNNELKRIVNLIRWHMFYYPSADWRQKHGLTEEVKDKNLHGWSDGAVRRFIKNVGGEDVVDQLIKLRIADATSNEKSHFSPVEIDLLENRIADVRSKDMALKISDLDITGNDLIELGYKHGPQIGQILNFLLDRVLDDPLINNKATLQEIVAENFPR